MKKFTLLITLMAFSCLVWAQCPPASPISAPYLEDFEGINPGQFGSSFSNCWVGSTSTGLRWESEDASGSNENSFDTGPFYDHTSFGSSGGMYIFLETSSGSTNDSTYFTSPDIDLSGSSNPQVSFWYHMYGATMGRLDLEVFNGTSWVQLFSVSGQQQTAGGNPWINQVVSLSGFSGVIQVRFNGVRGTGFTGDISIDDVLVGDPIACPAPSGLMASNVSSSTADVFFDFNGGGSSGAIIEYGPTGFTPGAGTTMTVSNDTATITGLSPQTPYDFYVTNDCGANGLSSQSGPSSFTTLVAGVSCQGGTSSFILTEGFDGSTTFNLTNGATAWTLNSGGTASSSTGPSGAQSGSGYAYTETTGATTSSFSMVSPGLDLTSASAAQLTFFLHAYGATIGTLDVNIGTSATGPFSPTSYSFGPGQLQTANTDPYQQQAVDLSAFVGNTVYVEFFYTAGGDFTGDLAIDFVQVEQCVGGVVPCSNPSGLGVANLTTTSADLYYTAGPATVDFDVEYGPTGFAPGTGTLVNTTNDTVSAMGLTPGTMYEFYVTANCSNLSSAQVGPKSFSTILCPPSNACTHPITLHDEFGDGYNGAVITVYQGGVAVGTLGSNFDNNAGNPPGDTLLTSINLCDGLDAFFVLSTEGGFPSEVGLDVFDPFSNQLLVRYDDNSATAQGDTLISIVVNCTPPSCPIPTALSATNFGTTTADLFFTASASATSYDVEYGPAGFTPGNGTVINTTNDTLNLTGLSAGTAYSFYVTADCAGNGRSTQAGPANFNTLVCSAANSCTHTLSLTDAFGDGWNGTVVSIYQNGAVVASFGQGFTDDPSNGFGGDFTDSAFANLCDGMDAVFAITTGTNSAPNYSEEISFDVYDPSGNLVGSYAVNPAADQGDTVLTINMISCSTVPPCPAPTVVNSTAAICQGDSIFLEGDYQKIAGTYSDTLTDATTGCDTMITNTTLSVNPTYNMPASASICQGDSLFVGGDYQTLTGAYSDTYSTVDGCDSVIVTTLTVLPKSITNTTASICQGDSLLVGGAYQTTSGVYSNTFPAANGCDSIVNTSLNVLPNSISNTSASICQGDSLLVGGAYQTTSGVYSDTFPAANGCDSVVNIALTVLPNSISNTSTSICQGDSLLVGGAYQTTSGVYSDTFPAANGCDSVVNTTLSVLPNSIANASAAICQGDSLFVGGAFQTTAGVYTDMFTASNGCDSTLVTVLTMNPVKVMNIAAFICNGDSLFLGGAFQTTAGMYVDTFATSNGCDSIVNTNLAVGTLKLVSTTASICQGDSLLIAGNFETTSGTYNDTLMTASGCDSVYSVILTVLPNSAGSVSVSICQDDSTFAGGAFQTTAGSYTDILLAGNGCDSILTTVVSVLPLSSGSATAAICQGESILIAGSLRSTGGTYCETFTGANGCDSTFCTTLTVLPLTITNVAVQICPGDSVLAGGAFQTAAGVYFDTLNAVSACDSIIRTTVSFKTSGCGSTPCVNLEVISLTLVNAATGMDIKTLEDGDTIDKSIHTSFTIRANTCSGAVGSVVFELNGVPIIRENLLPYAIAGGSVKKYNPYNPFPGTYQLEAIPYSLANGNGTAGISELIGITIVDQPPVVDCNGDLGGTAFIDSCGACVGGNTGQTACTPCTSLEVTSFTLVSAVSGMDIGPLADGDTIDNTSMGAFSIRANVCDVPVGSVLFNLNGNVVMKENIFPYDINGGTFSKPKAWAPVPGNYTLIGMPYSAARGKGTLGITETIDFTVIGIAPRIAGNGDHNGAIDGQQTSLGLGAEWSDKLAFRLYPNPTSADITVEVDHGAADTEVMLFAASGKLLRVAEMLEFHGGTALYQIDLSKYPKGMYLVKIQSGEGLETQRIIRQ